MNEISIQTCSQEHLDGLVSPDVDEWTSMGGVTDY
jgi:hypothetical protein